MTVSIEEYKRLVNSIDNKYKDVSLLIEDEADNPENRQALYDFIKEYDIDCKYLYDGEDAEKRRKAFIDFDLLDYKMYLLPTKWEYNPESDFEAEYAKAKAELKRRDIAKGRIKK